MGLGGCYGCIKYLLFAFNFIFWLIGTALLGFGIWVCVDPQFQNLTNDTQLGNLHLGAYLFVIVGGVVMVTGFLGCCGAVRESQCMLALFFMCLFVIFGMLVAAGVWALHGINGLPAVKVEAAKTLQSAVDQYSTDPLSKKLMDNVQSQFGCCGAENGITDYRSKDRLGACKLTTVMTPCVDEIERVFYDRLVIFAGVTIGIGLVMILGMIFSMMLCCAIRRSSSMAI